MSYCRFAWGGSDAYVIYSDQGYTCYCQGSNNIVYTETPEEMIQHLAEHRKEGKYVPRFAIEELWEEIDGPGEAVRPEPTELTQLGEIMRKINQESCGNVRGHLYACRHCDKPLEPAGA